MTLTPPCVPSVSLACAAVLSGLSVRTWQRRIEDGQVARCADATGRPHIALGALRVTSTLLRDCNEEDVALLLHADQGAVLAQAEIGACFALRALQLQQGASAITPPSPSPQEAARVAFFFLGKAADQGDTDAMHWLGLLHAHALGTTASGPYEVQALMWLSKAAAQGHAIARQQMQALLTTLERGIGAGIDLPPAG